MTTLEKHRLGLPVGLADQIADLTDLGELEGAHENLSHDGRLTGEVSALLLERRRQLVPRA